MELLLRLHMNKKLQAGMRIATLAAITAGSLLNYLGVRPAEAYEPMIEEHPPIEEPLRPELQEPLLPVYGPPAPSGLELLCVEVQPGDSWNALVRHFQGRDIEYLQEFNIENGNIESAALHPGQQICGYPLSDDIMYMMIPGHVREGDLLGWASYYDPTLCLVNPTEEGKSIKHTIQCDGNPNVTAGGDVIIYEDGSLNTALWWNPATNSGIAACSPEIPLDTIIIGEVYGELFTLTCRDRGGAVRLFEYKGKKYMVVDMLFHNTEEGYVPPRTKNGASIHHDFRIVDMIFPYDVKNPELLNSMH